MLTDKEIEEFALAQRLPTSQWHNPDFSNGIVAGAKWAMTAMLGKAASGFEEWFNHERGKLFPHEDNQMMSASQRDFYRWEEQAWQAATLSREAENKRLREALKDLEQDILYVKSGNVSLDDLVMDIERKRARAALKGGA